MSWITDLWWRGVPGRLFRSPGYEVDARGRNYWWVAPTYAQAKMVLRRIQRGMPEGNYRVNLSELSMTSTVNQSTLWFKSGHDADALYGEDVQAVVVDEASRVPEASWVAVNSTLTATQGPARIIGNVKGRKNWAYRLGRHAQTGAANWAYFRVTALDAIAAGVLTQEAIDQARAILPREVFDELYMAIPTEDGANPFGHDAIRACCVSRPGGDPSVWGWDLARLRDWTVGCALDRHSHLVRFLRFQQDWPVTVQMILGEVRDGRALVDATGVGDPVVQTLQREGGAKRYEGFKFTAASKQQLLENLVIGLQTGQVTYPPEATTLKRELEDFEFEHTRTGIRYSAPSGLHDDAVMAFALAYRKSMDKRSRPIAAC